MPRAEPVTIADLPSSTPIALCFSLWWLGSAEVILLAGSAGALRSRSMTPKSCGVDAARLAVARASSGGAGRRRCRCRGSRASRMFARWPGEAIQAATIAARRGQPERAPGDVLADLVAEVRADRCSRLRASGDSGVCRRGRRVRSSRRRPCSRCGPGRRLRGRAFRRSGRSPARARSRLIRQSVASRTSAMLASLGIRSCLAAFAARRQRRVACARGSRARGGGACRCPAWRAPVPAQA